MSPKKGPFQKEGIVFQALVAGCVCVVFWGEYLLVKDMDHNFAAGTWKETKKTSGTGETAVLF